jgi:hypothetical protein
MDHMAHLFAAVVNFFFLQHHLISTLEWVEFVKSRIREIGSPIFRNFFQEFLKKKRMEKVVTEGSFAFSIVFQTTLSPNISENTQYGNSS